jgi:hypothetical protein
MVLSDLPKEGSKRTELAADQSKARVKIPTSQDNLSRLGIELSLKRLPKEGSKRNELADQSKARGKRSTSQDNLSRLGIELSLKRFPPGDTNDPPSHLHASNMSSSASSVTGSETSTDLNLFSSMDASIAGGDWIFYELFPATSFSSFTGVNCHDAIESRLLFGCDDRTTSCSQTYTDELRKAETLVREHHGIKPSMYDFDEDSIIECIE